MLPLIGSLLIGLVAVDIFFTAFYAHGREGPLNRLQNRLAWRSALRLGGRSSRLRTVLLDFCGPFLALLAIFNWVVLLVAGFALIYYPFIDTFHVMPAARGIPGWVQALYYSGTVASTASMGDVITTTPGLRLLSVAEGLGGLAIFTVAITYELAVYQDLNRMGTLAVSLDSYFQDGVDRTLERASAGGAGVLVGWAERVTTELLQVLQAYYSHPVLHYFRPADRSRSLSLQLGCLLELHRQVALGQAPGAARELAWHPSYLALVEAWRRYLREVDQHFIPPGFEPEEHGPGQASDEDSYRRLLRYMGYDRTAEDREGSGREAPDAP